MMRAIGEPGRSRPEPVLGSSPGVVDIFIAEHIEPRYDELNTWPDKHSHLYLLDRAAKQLKIHVKKLSKSHQVLLHSGVAVGGLEDGVTSLVSHQAHRVCRSRALLKRYLRASGVPTLRSKVLHPNQFQTAIRFWEHLGARVNVKPLDRPLDQRSTVGVGNQRQLRLAWELAARRRPSSPEIEQQILIEEFREGLDVRAFVVGEAVAGAIARIPFYILGDGVSTIRELAEAEVQRRPRRTYLSSRTPQEITEDLLSPMGLHKEQVLPRGAIQHLTPYADSAGGGALYVDVTELLGSQLRQLAIDGMWALPGLDAAAVDLLVPELWSAREAAVTNIVPEADLTDFRYVDYGSPRRVHADIMRQVLSTASSS